MISWCAGDQGIGAALEPDVGYAQPELSAGNEYVLLRLERQQVVRILQQHEGLAHGTARDSPVFRRAEQLELAAVSTRP
jgi:hypothetical protein